MALTNKIISRKVDIRMPLLKRLFWLYFLLLIFEGALRKWFLPQLSAPLLLIRDPLALLIIWEAYRTRKWPKQWSSVIGILSVALIILCCVQVAIGENPWIVALYGMRSYLLPFPVAFIIGANLDEDDLRKFGVCTLWILLPLTALAVAQYLAPSSSILNKGAYTGMTQLDYASGHVRASETFSFVNGPTNYVPMAAAFIFYGLVNDKFVKKWLLWAASFATVLSIPVIGSRTQIVLLLAVVACVATAAMFGVSQLAGSVKVIAALLIVSAGVSQLPVFSEAMNTLEARLTSSSRSEGGAEGSLTKRVMGPIVEAIDEGFSSEVWYGHGMGLGSNAAATLMTGKQGFLAGEDETYRVVTELGGLCGLSFMLFRYLLALLIAAQALSRVRAYHPLAWFLVPVVFTGLTSGVLEQPTLQGFMVVSVGFCLAALKIEPVAAIPVLQVSEPIIHRRRLDA
ncbi:MAG: hypothetical protein P4K97_00375 [Terracidiphilus sp.]|nr:hypothetical protein [Terracidiphilus sp.]